MRSSISILVFLFLLIFAGCKPKLSQMLLTQVDLPLGKQGAFYTDDPSDQYLDRCFAKCWLQQSYKVSEVKDLHVYLGDPNTEDVEVEKLDVIVHQGRSIWERKEVDNCVRAREDDCLVWCHSTQDIAYESIYILKDPTQSTDYKVVKYAHRYIDQENQWGWLEVLCADQMDDALYTRVGKALYAKGYLSEGTSFNKETLQKAVQKYQIDHLLALGFLTHETLDALDVPY